MNTLKTLTGNFVLPRQSGQVRLFHSPRKGGPGNREVFLDKASTSGVTGDAIHRTHKPVFHSSVPGSKPDVVGRMIEATYGIEDGEVVKIFVQIRQNYGKRPKQANIFIRMREKAAYRKFRILLSENSNLAFTHAEIEGNFDVLEVEDCEALGIHIPPGYLPFASPSARRRVLDEDLIIHPEIEEPTTVVVEERVNDDGEKVVRFRKKRNRRGLSL